MKKFLGILFCGGKGTRLGEITKYISKTFIAIYDRPVFRYGLDMLEKSKYIDDIIILTNNENNEKFKCLNYRTIIQDDNVVFDMFSGWEYIKKVTGTHMHGVLMPGDNISNINIDVLIELFRQKQVDLVFSLFKVPDRQKLSQMGCYQPREKKFYYKHPDSPAPFGVVAPYIVRNSLNTEPGETILNHPNSAYFEHNGYWFDIGDYDSIIEAAIFLRRIQHV
ncbi:MAG TPA: sugar phosphate nucleotidyltransferase [Candidatus Deferrimicrobium sp.]|nr:sugar phosphate nucleotidyltransferase [Candidatus Deferrimicrobium sp.]